MVRHQAEVNVFGETNRPAIERFETVIIQYMVKASSSLFVHHVPPRSFRTNDKATPAEVSHEIRSWCIRSLCSLEGAPASLLLLGIHNRDKAESEGAALSIFRFCDAVPSQKLG